MDALEWGQTPWDDRTHEELLLEVKRMYGVIVALNSVAHLCKVGQEGLKRELSPFWSEKGGSGYQALELARQVLEPLYAKYDREDIYRCYFRYAYDLLFEGNMGSGWYVCSLCDTMIGRGQDKADRSGEACMFPPCQGNYRKLTWGDLEPVIK